MCLKFLEESCLFYLVENLLIEIDRVVKGRCFWGFKLGKWWFGDIYIFMGFWVI